MSHFESIQQIISTFHQAWQAGDLGPIETLLHEEVVFSSPDFGSEVKGKAACLQTFSTYFERAITRRFEAGEVSLHIWGNTAVAYAPFEVEYEVSGNNLEEEAVDLMVFQLDGEDWKLIYRGMANSEEL